MFSDTTSRCSCPKTGGSSVRKTHIAKECNFAETWIILIFSARFPSPKRNPEKIRQYHAKVLVRLLYRRHPFYQEPSHTDWRNEASLVSSGDRYSSTRSGDSFFHAARRPVFSPNPQIHRLYRMLRPTPPLGRFQP